MSKVRAFLEYYAAAAKGVPAGRKAEEALVELNELERSAEARGFERAREKAERTISDLWEASAFEGRPTLVDTLEAIRAMKDETP